MRTHCFGKSHLLACLVAALLPPSIRAASDFKLFTQPLLINSQRGEVTSYVALVDSIRFNFLPPPGWNVRANATDKTVVFLSPDLSTTIGLKFIPNLRLNAESQLSVTNKAEILARFPGSKITQTFPCHTSGAEGTAFDLESQVEDRPPLSIRFAVVPIEQNIVEFTLTTETSKFAKHHWTFGNLLTSFRVDRSPLSQ